MNVSGETIREGLANFWTQLRNIPHTVFGGPTNPDFDRELKPDPALENPSTRQVVEDSKIPESIISYLPISSERKEEMKVNRYDAHQPGTPGNAASRFSRTSIVKDDEDTE